jgi:two-component system chemotaxis sensor kinase CheA
MIPDAELFQLFKSESEEHLACLDDGLLRLEKMPADPALLEEVFRESHSLKGAAHMLGLSRIESTAQNLESLFNAARKDESPLTPETVHQMNTALDNLHKRVQEALAGTSQTATPAAAGALTHQPFAESITTTLPDPKEPPTPETPTLSRSAETSVTPSDVSAGIGEPFHINTVRVETHKLDDLLTQVGEISVIHGRAQHRLALMETLQDQWTALERQRRDANRSRDKAHDPSSTRQIEAMQRFGDLLKQARNGLFYDSARLASTINLLENQVRSIRLLPLSTLLTFFPRMVHDLAQEQGKEAELVIDGGEIILDKRILEEMKDPLTHLLRNAIDHGIEPATERERLGKPRRGTLRLSVTRDSSSVQLEVKDDGRGLDIAAIRNEALKRDLNDKATLAAMPPADLQQLIFTPGFSTTLQVTELSGHGVGLDVVRVNVERMKGSIHLESAAGQGLTVQLRLPLSITTTQILLTKERGRILGLPIEFVYTSRRVRAEDLFTLEGGLAILVEGQPVIAARLGDLLDLPNMPNTTNADTYADDRAATPPEHLACIVIQTGEGKLGRMGLLVEDLTAEEEVVPKPLGPPLIRVRNVSALAMLASGDICPVLNTSDLLRTAYKKRATHQPIKSESRGKTAVKPVVLLVEDSALIRAMEKRILEDAHYEVVTAVDGVDALNALASTPFAAVVSDIMMPNMDGLTLTERIRAEPRYQDMPIILVTTLTSDEDKRRGLETGANAYIPKPSFDQHLLLDTLKRWIVT